MRARCQFAPFALSVLISLSLAGCVTGRPLVLPRDLSRPGDGAAAVVAPVSAAGVVVAVRDFAPSDREDVEVGRDYDNVRPIRFPGNPGKSYADLLSRVLSDRGYSVRRLAPGEAPPPGAVVLSGTLVEFRANVKRLWLFKVETEARVAVDTRAEGGPIASFWTGNVAADVWAPQAFFVNPEKAGDALAQAAAAAAGETADRLGRLLPGGASAPPASAPPPVPAESAPR